MWRTREKSRAPRPVNGEEKNVRAKASGGSGEPPKELVRKFTVSIPATIHLTVEASTEEAAQKLAGDLEFTEWTEIPDLKEWEGGPTVDLLEIASTDTVEVREQ